MLGERDEKKGKEHKGEERTESDDDTDRGSGSKLSVDSDFIGYSLFSMINLHYI